MFVEQRTYDLAIGTQEQWLENYEKYGLEPQTEILGRLVGYFHTDFAELNQVVHMWAYESFEHRTEARQQFSSIGWPPDSGVMPITMENMLMLAADFSPVQ